MGGYHKESLILGYLSLYSRVAALAGIQGTSTMHPATPTAVSYTPVCPLLPEVLLFLGTFCHYHHKL